MIKSNKTWFNWHCPHCEHRNRATFPFNFEMPKVYTAKWKCGHCEKENEITWSFTINGWPGIEKKFELKKIMKKRRKKGREHVKKEDDGTKKDRGYVNNKV